jgi:DNA-binding response OmpR family regulator
VAAHKPDLLLLCSRMVLEDGIWRVLVTIRNSDRSCPVIFCANRLPLADALLRLSEGAILKGPDLGELKLEIKHVLAKNPVKNQGSRPFVENGWPRTKEIDAPADTENLISKEERNWLDYGFHAETIPDAGG